MFGRSSEIFGRVRVIFGKRRKYSGDLREHSEVFGRSSEIFGSFRVVFGNLRKASYGLRKSSEGFARSSAVFEIRRLASGSLRFNFGYLRCNLHSCFTFLHCVTLFCTLLTKNALLFSQSEPSNFFKCIIRLEYQYFHRYWIRSNFVYFFLPDTTSSVMGYCGAFFFYFSF